MSEGLELVLPETLVLRFLKVGIQTIVGPAISSLLFLAVFNLALSRSVQTINGINFANFIAPAMLIPEDPPNIIFCFLIKS